MKGRRTSSDRNQFSKPPQVSQRPSNVSGVSKKSNMPPKHPRSNMFVAQNSMDIHNPNPFVVPDAPIGPLGGRKRS